MVTANTALAGISSAFALLYAFWTGTIFVIFGLAGTHYQAFIYMLGLFLIIGVPLYQMLTGKRIIDVTRRNLAFIMVLVLVIMPFVIQGQYRPDDMVIYDGMGSETAADMLVADHTVNGYYWNTTPYYVTGVNLAETQNGNGTFTVTWSQTSQDADKFAGMEIFVASYSTASDTWNVTAFDQDTTDHIVAIGLRIETPTAGKIINYRIMWESGEVVPYLEGYLVSSESAEKMIFIPASWFAAIDEYTTSLADDHLRIAFWEDDADQFTSTNVIEVEIHFYASYSTDAFLEYMLYCGLISIFVAAAMTKHWNPTGTRRRRRYRYTSRRYGRYRRPRYRYRRRR